MANLADLVRLLLNGQQEPPQGYRVRPNLVSSGVTTGGLLEEALPGQHEPITPVQLW